MTSHGLQCQNQLAVVVLTDRFTQTVLASKCCRVHEPFGKGDLAVATDQNHSDHRGLPQKLLCGLGTRQHKQLFKPLENEGGLYAVFVRDLRVAQSF